MAEESAAGDGGAQGKRFEAIISPFYFWLPAIKADLGAQGLSTSVDVKPIDIIENLDTVFQSLEGLYYGSGHLRYEKIGFFYDVMYNDVGSALEYGGRKSDALDVTKPGHGALPSKDLTLTAGGEVDAIIDSAFSETMATLALTYRVFETPRTKVDLLAGLHVNDVTLELGFLVDADVAAQANLTIGPVSSTEAITRDGQVNAHVHDEATWVDPIIGVSARSRIHSNWIASGWAIVGGFDVNSRYLFDVNADLGYEWNNGLSLFAGYRVNKIDYRDGDFEWEMMMHGLMSGFRIRF